MYSAVHDAASVVVKGLNIFLSNKTRVDMAIEFSPNQKCPLRSKKDSMAQAILDDFKKVECYLRLHHTIITTHRCVNCVQISPPILHNCRK